MGLGETLPEFSDCRTCGIKGDSFNGDVISLKGEWASFWGKLPSKASSSLMDIRLILLRLEVSERRSSNDPLETSSAVLLSRLERLFFFLKSLNEERDRDPGDELESGLRRDKSGELVSDDFLLGLALTCGGAKSRLLLLALRVSFLLGLLRNIEARPASAVPCGTPTLALICKINVIKKQTLITPPYTITFELLVH